MDVLFEFLKAFLPGFSISVVAGVVSVWIGLIFFWKWRKRDFVKRVEALIITVVSRETKELTASNKRHSKAIQELKMSDKDFDKRLLVLEREHEKFEKVVTPELDKMSKQINDIYILLIERG